MWKTVQTLRGGRKVLLDQIRSSPTKFIRKSSLEPVQFAHPAEQLKQTLLHAKQKVKDDPNKFFDRDLEGLEKLHFEALKYNVVERLPMHRIMIPVLFYGFVVGGVECSNLFSNTPRNPVALRDEEENPLPLKGINENDPYFTWKSDFSLDTLKWWAIVVPASLGWGAFRSRGFLRELPNMEGKNWSNEKYMSHRVTGPFIKRATWKVPLVALGASILITFTDSIRSGIKSQRAQFVENTCHNVLKFVIWYAALSIQPYILFPSLLMTTYHSLRELGGFGHLRSTLVIQNDRGRYVKWDQSGRLPTHDELSNYEDSLFPRDAMKSPIMLRTVAEMKEKERQDRLDEERLQLSKERNEKKL